MSPPFRERLIQVVSGVEETPGTMRKTDGVVENSAIFGSSCILSESVSRGLCSGQFCALQLVI